MKDTPFTRDLIVTCDDKEYKHSVCISIPEYEPSLNAWKCHYKFDYFAEINYVVGDDAMQAYSLAIMSLKKMFESMESKGISVYYCDNGDHGLLMQ